RRSSDLAPVHAPAVPELVAVDVPSLDLHHVHSRDVIPVFADVGNGSRYGRVLLEEAIFHHAVLGNGHVRPLDRPFADVDEIDVVDEKPVIAARLDLDAVGASVPEREIGEPYAHGFDFDEFLVGIGRGEAAAFEDDFGRVPGGAVEINAVGANAKGPDAGQIVGAVGQHDGLAFR